MRAALALAGIFTALTFLVHFESSLWGGHLGYGFFRDELYFLVCGHHLAWGYVDQAPMVALQARLAELLFGISPAYLAVWRAAACANPGHDLRDGGSGLPGNLELPLDERL